MQHCTICGETQLPITAHFCGRCGQLLKPSAHAEHTKPTLTNLRATETLGGDEAGAQTIIGRTPMLDPDTQTLISPLSGLLGIDPGAETFISSHGKIEPHVERFSR